MGHLILKRTGWPLDRPSLRLGTAGYLLVEILQKPRGMYKLVFERYIVYCLQRLLCWLPSWKIRVPRKRMNGHLSCQSRIPEVKLLRSAI